MAGTNNATSTGCGNIGCNISLLNAVTASTTANMATGGVIDILDYATQTKIRLEGACMV
jgi:hypothetical protein